MHILRDKKGMTLVEVLVASALLVVLIGVAGGLIISSMNNSTRYNRMDNAKQMGIAVYDFYQDTLQNATFIAIDPTNRENINNVADMLEDKAGLQIAFNGSSGYETAPADGGHIYFKQVDEMTFNDLYGDDFYNYMTINTALYFSGTVMSLQVDVLWEGEVLFTKHSSFRLATLRRLGKSVTNVAFSEGTFENVEEMGSADDPLLSPTIYFLP